MHEGCEIITPHPCRVARKCFFLHLLGPPRHGVLEFVVDAYAAWQRRQLWRSFFAGRQRQQLELFDVDLQRGLAGAILCVDRSPWLDSFAFN